MYNSLHAFYTSREWLDLRNILMLERGMICECCHKLIHKKHQAIGHHKIELDMSNVNDAAISLNLDNLMLMCHSCHNQHHRRFGSITRHRYLVYGAPLSGKSTYVNECANKNDLVVSMDDIRYAITGGKYHENSGYTLNDVFAVRDLLLDRIKVNATKAHDVYIIGGYPYRGERERICRELKLEPVFIDVSREECLARLEADTTRDKSLWTKYISDWFDTYS